MTTAQKGRAHGCHRWALGKATDTSNNTAFAGDAQAATNHLPAA